MRVGIYSRWIDTLGGGEQTLAALAATLADHHQVDVISHDPPDWPGLQDRLGFDLRGVGSRVVPYDRDHYRPVQSASRDYDLFVNCSYLDNVRVYADINVMQVFFPPAPPTTASAVTPVPHHERDENGVRIRAIAGLHQLECNDYGIFAWSDGTARFELTAPAGAATLVTLRLASNRPRQVPSASVVLRLGDVELSSVALPPTGLVDVDVAVPGELLDGRPQFLDVDSDTFDPSRLSSDRRTALGVRVAGASAALIPDPRSEGRRRRPRLRSAAGIDRWTDLYRYYDAINTYDMLLANSHFTQRWIARRFGRASELLYPPVQVGQFRVAEKKQQIISVGRFFVEGHSKKQLDMIHAFRRLCDSGLENWEYHLVGGTHHDPGSVRYLEECRRAADGYPIRLHANAPLHQLVDLYAESALYWNATGYGDDPDKDPDHFEHFGMTTVEAMASGCVPLSLARAGQPEVIEHGWSGILWETFDDLEDETLDLVRRPARRARMAAAAIDRSKTFTYERFSRTLTRLLSDARAGA